MGGRAQALKSTMPALILGTVQKVAYTGTSAATSNAVVGIVRLLATTDCHVVMASSPTATTSNTLMTAGVPEYFTIPDVAGGLKVAAIRATASGTLYVTEMS